MKKSTYKLILVLSIALLISGCQATEKKEYTKYNETFYDTFDTLIQVVGYTESEEEFNSYAEKIHGRFEELHKLYDIYNDYEGINNIKTINDHAGIQPVKVEDEIIDLLVFSKEWYKKTGEKTNIAMGPVLKIWHDYREEGEYDPRNAKIPPLEMLKKAAQYTDLDKVVVDTQYNTVFLIDKEMSLDVGAAAKGYATEIVAKEIMTAGFTSGIISAGGNIRVLGKPLDGVRERWGVGIQDPDKMIVTEEQNLLDTIFVNDAAVVTSGDYQRYYIVEGKPIHHLIDPETLMPGNYYRAVTVLAEDSGLADFLSTTVFLMPYRESRTLVDSLEGVEAIWIMTDGKVEATEGLKKIMKSKGASGADKE